MKELQSQVDSLKSELAKQLEDFESLSHQLDASVHAVNLCKEENEFLATIAEDDKLITYIDGRYSVELRKCIYELLECHVSSSSIEPVIKAVLSLVGKTPDKLPHRSTIQRMNIERLVLSQKQIADIFPDQQHTTLYSDETSKAGKKYYGFYLGDGEGRIFSLGLRQIQTKSASDTLTCFMEVLHDIDDAVNIYEVQTITCKYQCHNVGPGRHRAQIS